MGSKFLNLQLSTKSISKKWTYKDINTGLTVNRTKRNVNTDIDIDAIESSIYNMFLFTKGERIIKPDFGNSLYIYLYEPINKITAKRIGEAIYDMFQKWEPRVFIEEIVVIPLEDENTYVVDINYSIPTLSDQILNFNYAINARR